VFGFALLEERRGTPGKASGVRVYGPIPRNTHFMPMARERITFRVRFGKFGQARTSSANSLSFSEKLGKTVPDSVPRWAGSV